MSRKKHDPKWTPFERCDLNQWIAAYTRRIGHAPQGEYDLPIAIWQNSRYEVHVNRFTTFPIDCPIVQLSIKRRDKREIHDWRDLQRIKNEIMGPEIEAIELYPAESRLVDTANQYHLWCFPPDHRVPVGYSERVVAGPDAPDGRCGNGARQRPFEDGLPPDAVVGADIEKRLAERRDSLCKCTHAKEAHTRAGTACSECPCSLWRPRQLVVHHPRA